MNMIWKAYERISDLRITILSYLYLGLLWTVIGLVAMVLSESNLFLSAWLPGVLDYGHLKPISSLSILFGGFLSCTLGLAYYILDNKAKLRAPLSIIAFACMKSHHLALSLGVAAILFGFNKGREFGEMPWIADNLLLFALLAFPVLVILALYITNKSLNSGEGESAILLLFVSMVGGSAIYLLGNFGIPFGFLQSIPLFTGMQDLAVQEIYRNGLLFFVVQASILGLLYYFIPLYYKTKLYSSFSIPHFVIIALLVLTPLSAASNLVYTLTPSWLQTGGIFCAMALSFAILGGGLNASYSISRSGKQFRSDALGIMLRVGIFFLLVTTIGRALLSPRFMQAWSAYTAFDLRLDLMLDLKSYGLLISTTLTVIVLQIITGKAYCKRVLAFCAVFWILGIILVYTGSLGTGISEYLGASALNDTGEELAKPSWASVFFHDSLLDSGNFWLQYLLSLRGVTFIGNVCVALTAIILTGYIILSRILPQVFATSSYEIPHLEYKSET